MRGVFFSLEGGEGTGKGTQAALLVQSLSSMGFNVLHTREPGGTALSETLRELVLNTKPLHPNTELLLMLAARSHHVEQVLRPSLDAGIIIVSERFTDSTIAYQGGVRGMERRRIDGLNDWIVGNVVPHRTYLLDNEAEVSHARLPNGDTDPMGTEFLNRFDKIRLAYLQIAKENPSRVLVVDSALPVEAVSAELLRDALLTLKRYGHEPASAPKAQDSPADGAGSTTP